MINEKIVAIDARMIDMTGIGTYIQHLMGQGIYDYALGIEEQIRKYDKDIKVIPFDAKIYSPKEQIGFPNKEAKQARIELVHFPHYNVPLNYRGRFVVTVHDLTHIILPEFLGNKAKYYYAKFLMNHALKKSEHIFTVSENSKKDIIELFGIKPEKISITYNAVDSDFRVKTEEDVEYLYEKYSVPRNKRILMYVGNLKPHKNLSRLIRAFSQLDDKNDYRLLLVGKAFTSTDLENEEKELGINEYVIHTGMVEKEELVDLYNIADLFVFPSLYEGFGIPPLEAMACGTPVIASNNSSIPEVVGNAAILFDAKDVAEIKNAIEKIVDEQLINNLIASGKKRVSIFKWDQAVGVVKREIEKML